MMKAELAIIDHGTGEVIALRDATDEQLAEHQADLVAHRDELAEAEKAASDEWVRRLDRNASWTLRVGDPAGDRQYEIKAPSPDAGTTVYDADTLLKELVALVKRQVISEDAAEGAVDRLITITARVPLDCDLGDLASEVHHAVDVQIAGVNVRVTKVDTTQAVRDGGVKKLAKVPGAAAALEHARRTVPGPPRKAKVKVIAREPRAA